MAQAKALQSKWKTIGPSTFKEDKKYWDAFRSGCDQLFSRQNEERGEQRAELAQAVSTCNDVLQALDSLFVSDDETFRESRKQFASLKGDFQNALGSRIKKERKPLLDKFNSITRRIESRFNTLPDRKTLEAQAALNEKARVCLDLEAALLEADEGSIPGQLLSDEIQARWQALPGCGKSELDKLMAMRFDRLRELKSKAELDRLVEQTELAARRQVIELEIKANIESPEADRQIRMEIQLRQLQDSFGRHGTVTPEEHHRLAREFGLTFLCLGPLAAATREELQKRTDKAVARLGSAS
jgi:anion-transporting  ArsA/GET3 family ATPase